MDNLAHNTFNERLIIYKYFRALFIIIDIHKVIKIFIYIFDFIIIFWIYPQSSFILYLLYINKDNDDIDSLSTGIKKTSINHYVNRCFSCGYL